MLKILLTLKEIILIPSSLSLVSVTNWRKNRFSQTKQVYSAEPLTPKPHAASESTILLATAKGLVFTDSEKQAEVYTSYLLEAVSITEIAFSPSLHCYRADACQASQQFPQPLLHCSG